MKKDSSILVYPLGKGLDTESIPGAQDKKSFTLLTNIVLNNRGSIKKMPGVERIPYSGKEEGTLQGACQFFVTTGGSQRSEVVRVRNGRVEAIRNENIVDLGITVNPTDTVSFTRFANVLVIHFENYRPQKYTVGGALSNLGIQASHVASPPTFSSIFRFRLVYGGMGSDPHGLRFSAVDNLDDYTLASGGFPVSVYSGDGDPVGITGLSPSFRGNLYVFKLNSIYRIFGNYEIDTVTTELGTIHHNTIVAGTNEIYFASTDGIHTISLTEQYGAVKEAILTNPIYKKYQDDINWSMSSKMVATFDKQTNCYLLSYASTGSSSNNRVMGFNVKTKEFFGDWEVNYPVLGKYFDIKRQRTLIGDQDRGMGILNEDLNTAFDKPISCSLETGLLFPYNDPAKQVVFTKLYLFFKPTVKTSSAVLSWYVDGDLVGSKTVDLEGEIIQYEGVTAGEIGTAIIGTSKIGKDKVKIKKVEVELGGEGHSISFEITHTPPDSDPDRDFELFGYKIFFDDLEEEDKAAIN